MTGSAARSGASDVGSAIRTYLDHLTVERGLADNTLKSYRRDLRRYVGWLADRGIDRLDGVEEATVSGFLMALREGDQEHPPLTAGSAGRTVVAVRGFHRFAVREGLSAGDPSAGVFSAVASGGMPRGVGSRRRGCQVT